MIYTCSWCGANHEEETQPWECSFCGESDFRTNKENRSMTVEIINLTPHTLNIQREDGSMLEIPASGQLARLAESRETLTSVSGIAVNRAKYGEITGLPEAKNGKIFVVSAMVLAQVKNRPDVFAPGEALRNEAGQIIGCKGLSAAPETASVADLAETAKYWRGAFEAIARGTGYPVGDPVDDFLAEGQFMNNHSPEQIARYQRIAATTQNL